jgi:hypothetical protein
LAAQRDEGQGTRQQLHDPRPHTRSIDRHAVGLEPAVRKRVAVPSRRPGRLIAGAAFDAQSHQRCVPLELEWRLSSARSISTRFIDGLPSTSMTGLDALPADQKAVLQLLRRQGKAYDELSGLLGVEADAVRSRAYDALDALAGGAGELNTERRQQVGDWLLGQQGPDEAGATRSFVEGSVAGRAWARTVAAELAPIAGDRLPEIPADSAAPDVSMPIPSTAGGGLRDAGLRVSEWIKALQAIQEQLDHDEVRDPARLAGADRVEGCVERAVVGELDPTGRLALGRYPPFLIPGAGVWLTKKRRYDASNEASRAGLAAAVRRTLAVGWLLASALDADLALGRDERDIFNIWAPGFRDPPANVVGKENERGVHHAGASVFVGALKEAGMSSFLGGSKVNQIGYVISGGGFLLRVIQSTLMDDEEFAQAAEMWAGLICEDSLGRGRWAWENFGLQP